MCLSLIKSNQITCLSPDFSRLRVLLSNSKEINFKELGTKDKDLSKFHWIEPPSFSQAGSFVGGSPNQATNGENQRCCFITSNIDGAVWL